MLKLAPYDDDDDDTSSFVSSLTITLTCLCGFAMMLGSDEYSGDVIGTLLVAIGSLNVVFELFMMVRGEYLARRSKDKDSSKKRPDKIVPVISKKTTKARAQIAWGSDATHK